MANPVFKEYFQPQAYLFPSSLEDLIVPNHPVRVVNDIVNTIDLRLLMDQYQGEAEHLSSGHAAEGGVYSYLVNIYSNRKMETAIVENIHLMWLNGMQKPDHNTLNRFRSERLKNVLKQVFVQVVQLLAEQGLVSLKEVYVMALNWKPMQTSTALYGVMQ